MREALIKMKPNHLEDIIALVALYRPGPMSNIPTYNDCKHGKQKPDYLHPNLEEILKPTYGVIIYQEQVMQIAQKLSGFTPGQADILRKAMGKKKRSELEKQKEKFIDGAVKNGIKKDVAASIFLKIEPFAEYGFNKSHAAAYGMISYQTAFLKTHFPDEFFAASMTMDISNQNKLGEFFEELKRLNINIIRPDINKCFAEFRSDNKNFYYALGGIKNVGFEAVSNIIKEREKNGKFVSINNFIDRVNPKDINKLQLEGLVKAGSFDTINNNRQSLFDSIPKIILKSKNVFDNKIANQIDLFNTNDTNEENFITSKNDWSFEERLSKEFEAVGFYISDHPLNQFKDIYSDYKIINFDQFQTVTDVKECNVAATLLKIQERKTVKGNSYAIIKLSDLNGVFELFIFSDILELNRSILVEGNSLLMTLNRNLTEEANRFKRVNVKKIVSLKELYTKPISEIEIEITEHSQMKEISELIKNEGNTEVKIKLNNEKEQVTFKLKNKRFVDRKLLNIIKNQDILTTIN